MDKLQTELDKLRENERRLAYLKEARFSSEDDYKIFYEENAESLLELKSITSRIKEIEWLMMDFVSKQEMRRYLIGLKRKFEGSKSDIQVMEAYFLNIQNLFELSNSELISAPARSVILEAIEKLNQLKFPVD